MLSLWNPSSDLEHRLKVAAHRAGLARDAAIGAYCRLLAYCDRHGKRGVIPFADFGFLDAEIGPAGFAAALAAVELLTEGSAGVRLEFWADEHDLAARDRRERDKARYQAAQSSGTAQSASDSSETCGTRAETLTESAWKSSGTAPETAPEPAETERKPRRNGDGTPLILPPELDSQKEALSSSLSGEAADTVHDEAASLVNAFQLEMLQGLFPDRVRPTDLNEARAVVREFRNAGLPPGTAEKVSAAVFRKTLTRCKAAAAKDPARDSIPQFFTSTHREWRPALNEAVKRQRELVEYQARRAADAAEQALRANRPPGPTFSELRARQAAGTSTQPTKPVPTANAREPPSAGVPKSIAELIPRLLAPAN